MRIEPGEIHGVDIPGTPPPGMSPLWYAFVQFDNQEDAEAARQAVHGQIFPGPSPAPGTAQSTVVVRYARENCRLRISNLTPSATSASLCVSHAGTTDS